MKISLNRSFGISVFVAATLLITNAAKADTYTYVDWDLQGLYSYKFLAQGQSYSGTWNINGAAGHIGDPGAPSFSSALDVLTLNTDFWFADDANDPDSKTTWIKTGYWKQVRTWSGWKSVWVSTGGSYQTIDNPSNYELVDITVGGELIRDNLEVDGTINYYVNLVSYDLVSDDLSTHISIVADLTADGLLNYVVKAVKGDTYLKESRLTVTATTHQVPDNGSTIALIGVALIGIAIVCRFYPRILRSDA